MSKRRAQTKSRRRSCQSGKVRYASAGSATLALLKHAGADPDGHIPIRFYGCDMCGSFHLSSKPDREGTV